MLGASVNRIKETYKQDIAGDKDYTAIYARTVEGTPIHRVQIAGAVTDVSDYADTGKEPYYGARISTRGGDTVTVFAGQYQPGPQRVLSDIDVPAYVTVIGKPRTYEKDGEQRVKIVPEEVNLVDEDLVNKVTVKAARWTLESIGEAASDTEGALKEVALHAARVVQGEASPAESPLQDDDQDEDDGDDDSGASGDDESGAGADDSDDDNDDAEEGESEEASEEGESEEASEGDESEDDSAEESAGGLTDEALMEAAGIQAHRAGIIAELYDDAADLITAAEEGTLETLDDVGKVTQMEIRQNADAIRSL